MSVWSTAWDAAGARRGEVLRGCLWRFAQTACLGLSYGVVVLVIRQIDATGQVTAAQVGWWVAIVVASLAGQLAFGYLSVLSSWTASYHLVGDLRRLVLARLRLLPMGFHVGRRQGDTTTALTSDMAGVEGFLSMGLPTVAQAVGLPLVVVVFLFLTDPRMAAATVVSIVVALPVFWWSNRVLRRLGLRRQDLQAGVASRILEYVQGIVVLRAFNQTGSGRRTFRDAIDDFYDLSLTLVRRLVVPVLAFAAVVLLGAPLVVAVGGYLFAGGQLTTATYCTFAVLVLSVYAPLVGLVGIMETLRLADASLERITRITTEPVQPEPQRPREPAGAGVAFRGVGFGYEPGRPVVRDVSFEVPERSMTAIVGPSGAGKSTLLQLVARFWDVDEGAVEVGGVDVREMTTERLYDLVSVVFQDVHLFSGTIRDNIAFGRADASDAEVEQAARRARAHDFVAALPDGYATLVGEGGATLSGGERQRISIARAVLKAAPIVLLDEPTASVDPTNEKLIHGGLAELVEDRTLLVIAHKLSTIRAADQIVVLRHGGVAERGRHEDLLAADGTYAALWAERERARGWRLRTTSGAGRRAAVQGQGQARER